MSQENVDIVRRRYERFAATGDPFTESEYREKDEALEALGLSEQ
jgi:hypothetical protein